MFQYFLGKKILDSDFVFLKINGDDACIEMHIIIYEVIMANGFPVSSVYKNAIQCQIPQYAS